jgi:DNA processing protein
MNPEDRLSLLALAHALFLSPHDRLVLMEECGGPRGALSLSRQDVRGIVGSRDLSGWDPGRLLARAELCEKRLTDRSIGCIFYWDRGYPPQLSDIYDPPTVLFFRGKLPENAMPLFAVVGTRLPTGAGRRASFSLGFELASAGAGVVSGLARGIDRESHEGCVAAGGWSAAVLGCGIDMISPASSRGSAARILDAGGLLLSEYPPGALPEKRNFPARNRIISGLCRAVVVVQAPERSGALITAEFALDQGRDLFVHRAGTTGTVGAGTRGLAESGAPVIQGAAEVIAGSGLTVRARVDSPREGPAGESPSTVGQEIAGLCVRRGGETFWRG